MENENVWLQELIGRTIIGVSTKIQENGDFYRILHFSDDSYYAHLAAFTANDHQVAIAKDALNAIDRITTLKCDSTDRAFIRKIIREVIEKMNVVGRNREDAEI